MSFSVTHYHPGCFDSFKHCVADFLTYVQHEGDVDPTPEAVERIARETVSQPYLTVLVALDGGTVAGFIVSAPHYWLESAMRTQFISAFSVLEPYRRQGVGKLLFEAHSDYVRQKGIRQVGLSVHKDNEKAIRFYTRQGVSTYLQENLMFLDFE